jgi:hypothetical protein
MWNRHNYTHGTTSIVQVLRNSKLLVLIGIFYLSWQQLEPSFFSKLFLGFA